MLMDSWFLPKLLFLHAPGLLSQLKWSLFGRFSSAEIKASLKPGQTGALAGKLATITRPRGEDWPKGEIAGWRSTGIDLVVSLLEPDEADQLGLHDESRPADAAGIQFFSFSRVTSTSLSLISQITHLLRKGNTVDRTLRPNRLRLQCLELCQTTNRNCKPRAGH
jgi:hypothetical protein